MTKKRRTIYDVDEERIGFLSDYLVDACNAIDPTLNADNLKHRLKAIEVAQEQYYYILDNKTPLLFVDLTLLMDGI